MDFNLDKLVILNPEEGAEEILVCGPDGCTPAPAPEPEPGPADHA